MGKPRPANGTAVPTPLTERLRVDRHRATEIGVTRVLIDAKSFAEAAPQAIAAICQAEEWALGEVWLYDAAASVLRLDGTWHAPGLRDVHGIELASAGLAIRPGVGLVGRVWQRDTPVWIRDLREEEELGWAEYADRFGLRSAVGFPIRARSGGEAVAVLFSQAIREPDDPLLDLLADIGSRIGQIFERDKVEASRRASVEAFQKAFHASPVPMAISSLHDGRFVEANLQFLRMFQYDRDEVAGRSSLELEMWVDQGRGSPNPHEDGPAPTCTHVDRVPRPPGPADDHHDPCRHHRVRRGTGGAVAARRDRPEFRGRGLRQEPHRGDHDLERRRGAHVRIHGRGGDRQTDRDARAGGSVEGVRTGHG